MTPAQPLGPLAQAHAGEPFLRDIQAAGRAWQIECQWLGAPHPGSPCLVFLHEGLGSVSMWRDFPARLCAALGCAGLIYSRPGYGRSTPRASDEHWGTDFMHRQADELLPALLQALGLDGKRQSLWLLGHSDGASIALLYAARADAALAGCMVLAPHLFVEDICITSIEAARLDYQTTDLRMRLARHHAAADSAFYGWSDVWTSAEFRRWSIEDRMLRIACPVLAIQGLGDAYGTLEQIHRLARLAPQVQTLELADCGHSPHRDQPQAVIAAAHAFMALPRATPG